VKWRVAAATAALLAIVVAAAVARELSSVGVHKGYAPAQPIAFSHKLHAGDFHVPCVYCHFGARTSRHAGIPPANVCMNCHGVLEKQTVEIETLKELVDQNRPIAWVKVHNLPDFVYFDHSRHFVAGIACQACHGRVEEMARVEQRSPLTMGWCLDCHRAHKSDATGPAANLDCGKCHY
jgi:Cytochrome c7 and related cytochrome c